MKRRLKAVVALAACLVLFGLMILACLAVLSLRSQSNLITRKQFALINVGMTRAEVESALGRARNEFRYPVIVWVPQRDGRAISAKISPGRPKLRFFPNVNVRDKGSEAVWVAETGLIAARFDKTGRLREKYFSTVHNPGGGPSVFDWLQSRPNELRRSLNERSYLMP